ncbi:MAG: BrnT family toxin [Candidatus Binatia bacterium]
MIDFETIEGFDWDVGNDRKSADKHQVSQAEVEQVFFNVPLVLAPDVNHSQPEPRFHALGKITAGRLLHITFTLRFAGRKIRPISARDMHRKERRVYEEQAQTTS